MNYKHLFGPVVSRRLGISLGVDLVPYKYCPLNCVYCEVQRTTHLVTERQEFFSLDEITAELKDYLDSSPRLDHITFSGAGEPTLYSRIGELIAFIKNRYPAYKLALLTNGTLLDDPLLREEILPCDVILPSLDAVSQEVFLKLNRPKPGLKSELMIESLVELRALYKGKIWLEVFIIPGLNDNMHELGLIIEAIKRIKPDLVQLNSLDRPGAEDWVEAADTESLEQIRQLFASRMTIPVEIIAKVQYNQPVKPINEEARAAIKSLLIRRPCTAEDLSSILNLHINEVSKILRQFGVEGKVSSQREVRGVFYQWIV